jgi:hypothetical protein
VDTDSGLLEPEDSLDDCGVPDVRDEGYSDPPDRTWAVNDWGLTAREASEHESLAGRFARELPEAMAGDGDGLGDATDTDGELYDDQVGLVRSGRLLRILPWMQAAAIRTRWTSASTARWRRPEEASIHVVPDRYETHLDD